MPVLSVITINYNNKEGLEKTISSVLSQSVTGIEFIIIDGGSSDGSRELLEKNKNRISYSVSEKDNGIYDAQNKGIKAATGDYLLFLNSGDTFYNQNVVENFIEFAGKNKFGIAYGNSNLVNNNQNTLLTPPAQLNKYYFFKYTLNHQACFISLALFNEFGNYSTEYSICSDFDFFLNVFTKKPEAYLYFNCTICNYDKGGLSSDTSNYDKVVKEKHAILRKYLTKEEFRDFYLKAQSELPFKYRFLSKVYRFPVFGPIIKKLFQTMMPGGK